MNIRVVVARVGVGCHPTGLEIRGSLTGPEEGRIRARFIPDEGQPTDLPLHLEPRHYYPAGAIQVGVWREDDGALLLWHLPFGRRGILTVSSASYSVPLVDLTLTLSSA